MQAHPEALGASPYNRQSALPYLLKILSVAKALSVQAHPDRTLAASLHASRPDLYPDDNHKPELACALTPFEAMCGFRPASEIVSNLQTTPELAQLVGAERVAALSSAASSADSEAFKTALRDAFTAFMSQPQSTVNEQATAIEKRLADKAAAASSELSREESVCLRLCSQFPSDIGIFAPFLLNVIALSPGEAVFLGANEPHAYLSGDCAEVMACSDNVVRAGLTPKHKDVPTLTSMLTYSCGKPSILTGDKVDERTSNYAGTVPEFVLQRIAIDGALPYRLPAIPSAAIVVVVEGECEAEAEVGGGGGGGVKTTLRKGDIFLQPATAQEVSIVSAASSGALLFRAHANSTTA